MSAPRWRTRRARGAPATLLALAAILWFGPPGCSESSPEGEELASPGDREAAPLALDEAKRPPEERSPDEPEEVREVD